MDTEIGKIDSKYVLHRICQQDLNQITQFTCNHYTHNEPMCIYRNVKPEMFNKSFHSFFQESCSSGLSWAFKENGHFVAVVLIMSYEDYIKEVESCVEMGPIEEILETLGEKHTPKNPLRTLAMFVACTDPNHYKKGLFSYLAKYATQEAEKMGYEEIVADCTNEKSRSVLEKMGYSEINRMKYEEFVYENELVFKDMKGVENLVLMHKKLNGE